MGQFESLTNQTGDHQFRVNPNNRHLQDLPSATTLKPGVINGPDFSHVVGNGSNRAQVNAPAEQARTVEPPRPMTQAVTVDNSRNYQSQPQARVEQVSSGDPPRPPHPGDGDSTSMQMGGLVSNAATIGFSAIAFNRYKASLRSNEISNFLSLSDVTKPESLGMVRNQADELTRLVASKGRELDSMVEQVALDKPHAFTEITEMMPAKGAGMPNTQLIFKQVAEPAALTQPELELAARSEYMRGLERTLVKSFNMGNTSTVSAFRTRQPYIVGLHENPMASLEGVAAPLKELETSSLNLLEETTTGRLALHNAASSEITKGVLVLGGSFAASRGLDRMLYGGTSQGFLTTAYDCAAPFLVFTKMSPLAKVAVMVGGHEVVRAIEHFTVKNKESE